MARKRFHKRGKRHFRRRWRRKYRKARSQLALSPQVFLKSHGLGYPMRYRTTLRYVEMSTSISSVLGAMGKYTFSANSCFDPNTTGAGHQPMYFDQLSAVYKYYRVVGSKITVRPTWVTGSPAETWFTVVCQDVDSLATYTDMGDAITSGFAHSQTTSGGFDLTQLNKKWMTCTFSQRKWANKSRNDRDWTALTSANPAKLMYFVILMQPLDLASNATFIATVIIDYIVDFFELIPIAES